MSQLKIALGAFGLLLWALDGTAFAAPPDAQQPAPVPNAQVNDKAPPSRFQAAPVPRQTDATVKLSAPVAAPYSGTAYRDLGGQPETSADALDSQGARPR